MDEAIRMASIGGIAFVVLFAAGNALWAFDMPDAGAPAAEVLAFYRDSSGGIVAGATLSLLAIVAFVVFAAGLRELLACAAGGGALATAAFAGALLAMATGAGAEAINMAAAQRARDGALDEALARSLFEVSQALGSSATAVGVAVFALATAAVALRSALVLPRWLGVAAAVVGVANLTPLGRMAEVPGGSLLLLTALIAAVLLRRGPSASGPPTATAATG